MDVARVDNAAGNTDLSLNIFRLPNTHDIDQSQRLELKKEYPKEETNKEESPSSEVMKKIAESIKEQVSLMNSSLSFQVYGNENDKIAIVVSDKATGKIIREIPSKEIQQMQAKLDELIGLIYNGSA